VRCDAPAGASQLFGQRNFEKPKPAAGDGEARAEDGAARRPYPVSRRFFLFICGPQHPNPSRERNEPLRARTRPLRGDNASLSARNGSLRRDNESLRTHNESLRTHNESLPADNGSLRTHNDALRGRNGTAFVVFLACSRCEQPGKSIVKPAANQRIH
jgi:hypothetical protein